MYRLGSEILNLYNALISRLNSNDTEHKDICGKWL